MQSQDDTRLDAALNELRTAEADVPDDLRPAVMDAVQRMPSTRQNTSVGHGGAMTRKAMLGLAAAAAVILAIFSVTGFPPELGNIQATIGQAKRYTAPQMAAGDATVGDPAVQQFIQSETFAALLADREAMRLLSNADVRNALASQDLATELRSPDLVAAVAALRADASTLRMLNDAEVRVLLRSDLRNELVDAELVSYLADSDLRLRLSQTEVKAALRSGGDLYRALGHADFARYLQARADIHSALTNDALIAALSHADLVAALRVPSFAQAIRSDVFLRALATPGFARAFQSESMLRAISDSSFAAAIKSAEFANAVSGSGLTYR